MTALLITAWVTASTLMLVAWILQRRTGNAGWVDVLWPASMAAIAIVYALQSIAETIVSLSIALMAGIWAARLVVHIGRRVSSEPEDPRYRDLRQWFGAWEQPGLLGFYQLQAVAALLLSTPWLIAVSLDAEGRLPWVLLAWAIWLGAVSGEWVADRQLAGHRADPGNRGITCRRGLWRYSRHPNYFFEWLLWVSYLPLCVGAPNAWVALLSPVTMILFLVFITGIPHTERRALESRGEDYRRYQQTTSAFFPWFPKEAHDENRH